MSHRMTIVEVGPRDGFQSVGPLIPTAQKLEILRGLYDAGVRRVEATAFVSEAAVPQMADAKDILKAIREWPGLDPQVLVPNLRHADRAVCAGATHLAFVLSVSERHNRSNVKRSPQESAVEYRSLAAMLPDDVDLRLNLATAFDCPFDGPMAPESSLTLLDELVEARPDAEICLCDTTGRVTPDRVADLFRLAQARFPGVCNWAFHGHDTYGMGVANVMAARASGVPVIDSSIAGLGGCPFAPGATGNVATEDVAWALDRMGIETGIDMDRLLAVARITAALPGAQIGGRVREAWTAALCRETAA
jgi:hydroxymethylglutaryl-CoA lyase